MYEEKHSCNLAWNNVILFIILGISPIIIVIVNLLD